MSGFGRTYVDVETGCPDDETEGPDVEAESPDENFGTPDVEAMWRCESV